MKYFRNTNNHIALLLISSIFIGAVFCGGVANPTSEAEKESYVVGYMVAKNFKGQNYVNDLPSFKAGIMDTSKGQMKYTDEELQTAFTDFDQKNRAAHADPKAAMAGAVHLEGVDDAKVSYYYGNKIWTSFAGDNQILVATYMAAGFEDSIKDKPKLTEEEIQTISVSYQDKRSKEMAERRKIEGEKNLKEGEAYLVENKKKAGMIVTKTGLQYQILTKGTGAKPKSGEEIVVHYTGTTIDGKEFDSSFKRNEPAIFKLPAPGEPGLIAGWVEALHMMPIGSKWELVIPANLGYGEAGSPPVIGPNAVLIFIVELLDIKKAAN